MKRFFITGATGAVGSALVRALLADRDIHLSLLVRAKSAEDLQRRFHDLQRFWEVGASDVATRIELLRGDASQPGFGLNPAEYERLAQQTTHIVHSAASVKMTLPLEDARASAVKSMEEILALAARCRINGVLSKVDVISTVGVGGYTALVAERPMPEVTQFHNTYEASKAEAEKIVFAQWSKLPITVHRPSMVVGDSQTGKIIHFQIFYYLCEFFSGRYTWGVLPDPGETRLDTIPVDYVADAIKWSCLNASTAGHILHLCSGPQRSIRLHDLAHMVRGLAHKRGLKLPAPKFIPRKMFRAALPLLTLVTPRKYRRTLDTLPVFLNYLDSPQAFINHDTDTMLDRAGLRLPPSTQYLENCLNHYHQLASRQSKVGSA